MPTALMMTGTTIGEIRRPMMTSRHGRIGAAQAERRERPERRRQDRDRCRDHHADLQRQRPAVVGEEILVPTQRQAGHRKGEIRLGVEGQRHDHENRRDQEQQHEHRK